MGTARTRKTINTSQLTSHRNQSGPEKGQSGQKEILARRGNSPIRKAVQFPSSRGRLNYFFLNVKLSISPAHEVLQHGRLSRRLPPDDRDLRQVYHHGHAELREDVLDLVDEGDEGLHPYVTLLRPRHGGGRRVVSAAGHCKGLLHLLLEALAVVVGLGLGLLLFAFDLFSFTQDVVSPLAH